jgi:hypothetical protein
MNCHGHMRLGLAVSGLSAGWVQRYAHQLSSLSVNSFLARFLRTQPSSLSVTDTLPHLALSRPFTPMSLPFPSLMPRTELVEHAHTHTYTSNARVWKNAEQEQHTHAFTYSFTHTTLVCLHTPFTHLSLRVSSRNSPSSSSRNKGSRARCFSSARRSRTSWVTPTS